MKNEHKSISCLILEGAFPTPGAVSPKQRIYLLACFLGSSGGASVVFF